METQPTSCNILKTISFYVRKLGLCQCLTFNQRVYYIHLFSLEISALNYIIQKVMVKLTLGSYISREFIAFLHIPHVEAIL